MKTVVIVDNNTEILRQVEDSLNKVKGINVIGTAEDGHQVNKTAHNKQEVLIVENGLMLSGHFFEKVR
ncbi:MAG: hypothetical protein E7313_08005 [Clostridiales bacterium]|nr:hypothetical protein [Clostridiales bacterium]